MAENLESMVLSGKMVMMNTINGTQTTYLKKGGKVYSKATIKAPGMTMEVIQGCDGGDCYSTDPNFGTRLLEGQEKEMTLISSDFQAMADWRKMFVKAEYKGMGEFNGRKVFLVDVETAEGMTMTQEIDAETYLTLRSKGKTQTSIGNMEFVLIYSDYKDVHKGFKMPMRTENIMMNQSIVITIEEVEINPTIPDSKFALPPGLK